MSRSILGGVLPSNPDTTTPPALAPGRIMSTCPAVKPHREKLWPLSASSATLLTTRQEGQSVTDAWRLRVPCWAEQASFRNASLREGRAADGTTGKIVIWHGSYDLL